MIVPSLNRLAVGGNEVSYGNGGTERHHCVTSAARCQVSTSEVTTAPKKTSGILNRLPFKLAHVEVMIEALLR